MAGRTTKPGRTIRFMQPQEFEDEAALILAEYRGNKTASDRPASPNRRNCRRAFRDRGRVPRPATRIPGGRRFGGDLFQQKEDRG